MKQQPKYPETPRRNCLYCFWYNQGSNACDNPKMSPQYTTFHKNEERDCLLLRFEKTENPEVPEKAFAQKFCIGQKCPYYYASKKLCTRPSLCPYKDEDEPTVFTTIKLKD